MKKTLKHTMLCASALFLGLSIAAPASAKPDRKHPRAQASWSVPKHDSLRSSARRSDHRLQFAAVKVSASQAKAIALSHVRGSEFLDIRLVEGHTYRVRVMKDGRRIDVYVDANSGRVK